MAMRSTTPECSLAVGQPCDCTRPHVHAGETIAEEYITEYSTDKIEMHKGHVLEGQRVLLVRRHECSLRVAWVLC